MDEFKKIFDAFKNLEKLPDKQKKELEEKLSIITGSNNALEILKMSLEECNIDEETFKEIYFGYKNEEKNKLLSTTDYFKWIFKYIGKNQKLASYHSKKENLKQDEKQNILKLKNFYDGINEYAKEKNIVPYIIDNLIKRCYFVEYNSVVLGITLYGFDDSIMCQMIDKQKLEESNAQMIDFADILKYYRELEEEKLIQYDRK